MFGCGKLLKQILATLQGIAVGIDDNNKKLSKIEAKLEELETKSDVHFRVARGGQSYAAELEKRSVKK